MSKTQKNQKFHTNGQIKTVLVTEIQRKMNMATKNGIKWLLFVDFLKNWPYFLACLLLQVQKESGEGGWIALSL